MTGSVFFEKRSEFCKAVRAEKHLVGTFAAILSPMTIEILSQATLDFICIDTEHSSIASETLENMLRAADVHSMPAIVRVQNLAPDHIQNALDAGAAGVLVPRISTAAEARAAVAFSLYPPAGRRGAGPGRIAGYGYRIGEAVSHANQSVLVAIQIETREGLDNAEELVAVDGIDLILVGPGDLAVSLGAVGSEHSDRLGAAITQIITTARAAAMPVGIFCSQIAEVDRWKSCGATLFIVGSDATMLSSAAHGLGDTTKR